MSKLILPFNGRVKMTSKFGMRTLNGSTDFHGGWDLVGIDDPAVIAPCDAVVGTSAMVTDHRDSTWEWGNFIRLDAKFNGENIYIFLCHLDGRYVKQGDRVRAGQHIGLMGNTGYSFGAHTHTEIRNEFATPLDPSAFFAIPNEAGTYRNDSLDESLDNTPDEYAQEAVNWAVANDILRGSTNGDYKLHDNITRQDMLVFLHRSHNI